MPWTETISPLTIGYRRADVLAFWALGVTAVVIAAAVVAWAAGLAPVWPWAAGAAAVLLVPGLFWPRWFETVVWIWNGGSRRLAAWLRAYVLFVTYTTIIGLTGQARGSTRVMTEPVEAVRGWHRRGRIVARSPRLADADERDREQGMKAVASLSGQPWVHALTPVMFLLALLRDEYAGDDPPANTYTLY
jgi:hypothetical protein